mmetsp:Transcript_57304/g.105365  ORF Transcript_57304/g.105365 Transcript_57304/m.105365 type:complete len:559 (-) Transcript_57304:224-1900(-)
MPKTKKKHTFHSFSNQHWQSISAEERIASTFQDYDEQKVSLDSGASVVSPNPKWERVESSSNSVPRLSEIFENQKDEAADSKCHHVMPKMTTKHTYCTVDNLHEQTLGSEKETSVVSQNTKGWRVNTSPSSVPRLSEIVEDQAGEKAGSKGRRVMLKAKKKNTYRPFDICHESTMSAEKEAPSAPSVLPEREAPVVRKETKAWRVDCSSSSVSRLSEIITDQTADADPSLKVDEIIAKQEAIAERAVASWRRVDAEIFKGPTPSLQDVMDHDRVDKARRLEWERHIAEIRQKRDQLASQSLSENMNCLREVSEGSQMIHLNTLLRVAAAKTSREYLEEAASKAGISLSHPMMSQMFFVQHVASFSFEQTKKEDTKVSLSVPGFSYSALEQLDQRVHRRFEIFRSFMRRAVVLKRFHLKLPLLRYHSITLCQLIEPWTYDVIGSAVRPLWIAAIKGKTLLTTSACMLISKFVSLPTLAPPLVKECEECIRGVSHTIASKIAVLKQNEINVAERIKEIEWKIPKTWVKLTDRQQVSADVLEELQSQQARLRSEISLLRSF